jgi:hypothetical protein
MRQSRVIPGPRRRSSSHFLWRLLLADPGARTGRRSARSYLCPPARRSSGRTRQTLVASAAQEISISASNPIVWQAAGPRCGSGARACRERLENADAIERDGKSWRIPAPHPPVETAKWTAPQRATTPRRGGRARLKTPRQAALRPLEAFPQPSRANSRPRAPGDGLTGSGAKPAERRQERNKQLESAAVSAASLTQFPST